MPRSGGHWLRPRGQVGIEVTARRRRSYGEKPCLDNSCVAATAPSYARSCDPSIECSCSSPTPWRAIAPDDINKQFNRSFAESLIAGVADDLLPPIVPTHLARPPDWWG